MRWAGAIMVIVLLLVAFTAPSYDVDGVSDPTRLGRLADRGELSRPGLVISTHDNYYLSGRSLPVALVSRRANLLTRLWFPFAGRSLVGRVRDMRAVKDEAELQSLRRAAEITSQAFADIRPIIRRGVSEAEVERGILRSFRRHGATGVAFNAVVGSGANAVLPHYMKNDAPMTEGLVVIDIGCSFDSYASDMTRTFSVDGDYTDAQRHLIETVIAAGDAARAALGPGVTMKDVDRAARGVIEEAGFGPYFLHSIGHHVGLSVHDPGRSPLREGMVLTIEPGIYISKGADTDPAYWSLGVRIEDTYIVTEDGWEEITDYPRRPYTEVEDELIPQASETAGATD
jgi:Xaa-Pro aminopeptidase